MWGVRLLSGCAQHASLPLLNTCACVQVTAANMYDATSATVESEAVVVGLPDAPTLPTDAVSAGVGKITLKWDAAATNAQIGTT